MSIVATTQELGATIRSRRIEKGYTQTELADLSGSSVMFISGIENGNETAQVGKILHVLHMLGLDLLVEARED